VSYMQIHILTSQIIVTMKLDSDSDSDVPTTSSHKQLRSSTGPRAKRGIPCDPEGEGKRLKNRKSAFRRKGDVMVQVWKDKTCVNDKHNA
jgi:hypothetical protein